MSAELQMKAALLAAESSLTRKQAARVLRRMKNLRGRNNDPKDNRAYDLDGHARSFQILDERRRVAIRNEARATHLARSFIRGRPYAKVEEGRRIDKEKTFFKKVLPRVGEIIRMYDDHRITDTQILRWVMKPVEAA